MLQSSQLSALFIASTSIVVECRVGRGGPRQGTASSDSALVKLAMWMLFWKSLSVQARSLKQCDILVKVFL